jgi:hypothetical protein
VDLFICKLRGLIFKFYVMLINDIDAIILRDRLQELSIYKN